MLETELRNGKRDGWLPSTENWPEQNLSRGPEAHSCLPEASPPGNVTVGQILGHYRVTDKIAAGAMGVVYRARDERLERQVALKVLPPSSLQDPIAQKRFRNEALALSKLNHPKIATVHVFDTQDGIDFLIMEYVPGQTLEARLEHGALTEEEVFHIGIQIADAMEEAHQQGIIHRDLKPSNVIITPCGRVKVADFGLAILLLPVGGLAVTRSLTRADELVGTMPYMAPEQLRGEAPDVRSDIYSIGAVLYELATGQRPFPQMQLPCLIDSILHEVPRRPRSLTLQVSLVLENIILKCLAKEPERRYQSAAGLRVDLQRLSAVKAFLRSEIKLGYENVSRLQFFWLLLWRLFHGLLGSNKGRHLISRSSAMHGEQMRAHSYDQIGTRETVNTGSQYGKFGLDMYSLRGIVQPNLQSLD